MQQITITPDIETTIYDLSQHLHIPELEVIRRAIEAYAEKIRRKQRLMSFAGLLTETEADDLLQTIQASRVNKHEAIQV